MRPDDVVEIAGDDLGVAGRTGHIAVGPNQPETARADRRTYIGVEQSCKSREQTGCRVVRSASSAKSGALPDPMSWKRSATQSRPHRISIPLARTLPRACVWRRTAAACCCIATCRARTRCVSSAYCTAREACRGCFSRRSRLLGSPPTRRDHKLADPARLRATGTPPVDGIRAAINWPREHPCR